MKILLLIILATFSIASTQYKTPVFVVENSTLYCLKHEKYNNYELIKYNPGDLVSGDYASNYCSYNFESITDRIDARVLELKLKKEQEEQDKEEFGIGSFLLLFCFMALIFICLPQDHKVKDE